MQKTIVGSYIHSCESCRYSKFSEEEKNNFLNVPL